MHLLIQSCLLGILTGGVYALMASGLTLAFGVMKVINVAQGALIILGAYLSYTLFTHLHIDPFVGILIVAPLSFALGVALQLVFIRPLRADEREELSLLVTWAIALGIEGLLSVIYHTTYRSTLTGYANKSLTVAGYHFSVVRLMAFGVSAVILVGLYALLSRTSLGRSIRATVQNPTSARLLGIDAARVSASLGGAVAAALVMGVGEAVFAAEVSPTWSSFTFFVVLIAILLVRPQGLFGVRERGAL
jgi:branched-chain amino acid transport system permease protein